MIPKLRNATLFVFVVILENAVFCQDEDGNTESRRYLAMRVLRTLAVQNPSDAQLSHADRIVAKDFNEWKKYHSLTDLTPTQTENAERFFVETEAKVRETIRNGDEADAIALLQQFSRAVASTPAQREALRARQAVLKRIQLNILRCVLTDEERLGFGILALTYELPMLRDRLLTRTLDLCTLQSLIMLHFWWTGTFLIF